MFKGWIVRGDYCFGAGVGLRKSHRDGFIHLRSADDSSANVDVCLDNNYRDGFFNVSGAVPFGIAKSTLVKELSACIVVPSYLDNRHPPG